MMRLMDESPKPLFPDSLKHLFGVFDRFVLNLAEKPLNSILLIGIFAFFLYGFYAAPTDYFKVSQAPFEPYTGAPYIQDSILLPVSAYYLGLNHSQSQFDLYTICIYMLALVSIYIFGYRRFRLEILFFLALSLAFSPASLSSFIWPGIPDSFTILFSVIAVFSNSIPILFLTALLGVLNHPQFLFIGIALIILRLTSQEKNFKVLHALAILFGMIAGYGIVQAFLSYNHIHIQTNRFQLMFEQDLSFWLESKIVEAPLSLFSLYQGLWFILPVCFLYGFSRKKSYYVVFLLLQCAAGAVTLFVLDTTRIFSLLTIGTILHAVAFTYNSIENEYIQSMRWLFTIIFIGAIFLPHYVILSGQPYIPQISLIPYLIFSLILGK
jgi:hypothetical protein